MTDNDQKDSGRPFLADILVLDLAEGEAAFCSKLLADLGAIVIKVEPPSGDPARRGAAFLYHNTNKLGVTVDPCIPEDSALLRTLIKRADVLIDTFHRERAEAFGIAPKQALGVNPALVHLSITGFGRSGPRSGFRWCDEVLSAFGGQACLTGPRSGPPRPLPHGQPLYASSLFGAVAVLLALRHRRLTGEGRHIDLSAQEAVASTLDHVMVDYFRDGTVSARQGNVYGDGSFAILPASDGHILLGLSGEWETVTELAAAEGKANDLMNEEWKEQSYRTTHLERALAAVGVWTRGHAKEDLFALGQAMRFAWAPVYRPEEALGSPQLSARRFFAPAPPSPGGKNVSLPGLPYRFRCFSPPPPGKPPLPGEHNEAVFGSPPSFRSPERAAATRRDVSHGVRTPVLHGLKVLDFTWMLAGPYATRILADFGAEVIKVQSVRAASIGEGSDPVYDAAWNRNKRSIALDLGKPEARAIVSGLVSTADVVVENFSPRVMASWGLSYDDARQIRPGIVMASISAMGHTGPWKDYVGFGPTFHALSGLISEASVGLDTPVCPGHAYGDTVIGLYAALAIVAALERKEMTGQGEYIDLSGFEALCTLLGPSLIEAGAERSGERERERGGEAHAGWYPCRGVDRWCVIVFEGEADWKRFLTIAGLADPRPGRSSSFPSVEADWQERDACVASWTADRASEDVIDALQRIGLAAGAVQDAGDLVRDPQLAFRRFFVSLDHPTLGTLRSDRSALFMEDMAREEWKAAPLPGEDTRDVLGRLLGMSEEEIQRYADAGVIA